MHEMQKVIPANNGADAARFDRVEMVHNCCVDGFNLVARDAVVVSARDMSRSP